MRRGRASAALGTVLLLAVAPAAGAQSPAVTGVAANGNIFTGGLSFAPAAVTVPVGGIVRWTNTDFVAPHTATEDHGLWSLSGSYGQTPVNPAGFGPGTSVQRAFEAGTTHYYCLVHPTQMRAVVSVPVSLAIEKRVIKRKVRRKGHRRKVTVRRTVRTVVATWAVQPPANGEVFDVQVRRGTGAWGPLVTGTSAVEQRLSAGKAGTVTGVRARLRSASDATKATDWSPDASITSS
jgi:plastocyanin